MRIAFGTDERTPLTDGLVRTLSGQGHDVVVLASHRGQRLAQRMLALVEAEALARGACKLTLEVLSGNRSALRAYEREGFGSYQLDPAFGSALFLQKKL